MKSKKVTFTLLQRPAVWLALLLSGLVGCGSGSDDDSTGYIKFYNAAANAPAIYMSVDENLDEDDDDEVELTYSSVAYGSVSATNSLESGQYYVELAYQVDDSAKRDDLALIYQERLSIKNEQITFVVLTGDVRSPEVLSFDIAVVDDDNDADDDLFNVRLLNLSENPSYSSLDLYMSKDNQTFNEAKLVGTVNAQDLSDNLKLAQEDYIYYLTLAGSSEVLYRSDDISYASVNQYIIAIRDNAGVGSSPFTIDSIGTNGITRLDDVDSEAQFTFYNAIAEDLIDGSLPNYQGAVNVVVKKIGGAELEFENIAKGQFSEMIISTDGDYNFSVKQPNSGEIYIASALLSLEENADNTIFLYGIKSAVDDDNDGDTDENDDGIVDAWESKIKSLVVTNSNSSSIYSHAMKLVNLADSDEFSRIKFAFVQNNESISTATYTASVLQEKTGSLSLLNNTYDVYAIATIDGMDVILDSVNLVLDEDSQDQFVIFEADPAMASGFKMTFVAQKSAG